MGVREDPPQPPSRTRALGDALGRPHCTSSVGSRHHVENPDLRGARTVRDVGASFEAKELGPSSTHLPTRFGAHSHTPSSPKGE